jgi:hypothetical protein
MVQNFSQGGSFTTPANKYGLWFWMQKQPWVHQRLMVDMFVCAG